MDGRFEKIFCCCRQINRVSSKSESELRRHSSLIDFYDSDYELPMSTEFKEQLFTWKIMSKTMK